MQILEFHLNLVSIFLAWKALYTTNLNLNAPNVTKTIPNHSCCHQSNLQKLIPIPCWPCFRPGLLPPSSGWRFKATICSKSFLLSPKLCLTAPAATRAFLALVQPARANSLWGLSPVRAPGFSNRRLHGASRKCCCQPRAARGKDVQRAC